MLSNAIAFIVQLLVILNVPPLVIVFPELYVGVVPSVVGVGGACLVQHEVGIAPLSHCVVEAYHKAIGAALQGEENNATYGVVAEYVAYFIGLEGRGSAAFVFCRFSARPDNQRNKQ